MEDCSEKPHTGSSSDLDENLLSVRRRDRFFLDDQASPKSWQNRSFLSSRHEMLIYGGYLS